MKEQGRGICACLEECPGQKTQLVKMPGVPETLSGGVNEKGDRGWAREETPGVLGAAPCQGRSRWAPINRGRCGGLAPGGSVWLLRDELRRPQEGGLIVERL